jgi:hypothetical protein
LSALHLNHHNNFSIMIEGKFSEILGPAILVPALFLGGCNANEPCARNDDITCNSNRNTDAVAYRRQFAELKIRTLVEALGKEGFNNDPNGRDCGILEREIKKQYPDAIVVDSACVQRGFGTLRFFYITNVRSTTYPYINNSTGLQTGFAAYFLQEGFAAYFSQEGFTFLRCASAAGFP